MSILSKINGALPKPPDDAEPFALFGMPPRAVLDDAALRAAWLKLCREVHPDRFQAQGGEQLMRARRWTELINNAYGRLSDLESRLELLLEGTGFSPEERERKNADAPRELMAQVFEAQELLDEVVPDRVTAEQRTALTKTCDSFRARHEAVRAELAALAARWDGESAHRAAIAADITRALGTRRYIARLLERIEGVLGTTR